MTRIKINIHITRDRVNKGVAVEPASRVFLSTDVLGQSFLCYLVKARAKLMVAKFNKENSDRLIGPATAIDALDAAPLLVRSYVNR